jgi:hypothetical protein
MGQMIVIQQGAGFPDDSWYIGSDLLDAAHRQCLSGLEMKGFGHLKKAYHKLSQKT